MKKSGMKLSDVQAVEINEAFAVQVLACQKALASDAFVKSIGYEGYNGEIKPEILNVNGGAIALGHPVGATGVRFVVTLIKEMARRKLSLGMAALCVGGGLGASIILERK